MIEFTTNKEAAVWAGRERPRLGATMAIAYVLLAALGVILTACGGGGGGGGGGLAVPAAPTGLQAAGGNAQVTLTWSPSAGAASYNVKRSTTSGGPYTTAASPTSPSYTDTGLTNGTTYYYVVSAVNSAGESPNSAEAKATPNAPPGAPTGLAATAGNAQVSLTWNGTAGATSYNVKRSTTSGGPYTTIASPTSTNYTDTGLTKGVAYYYVVSAVNSGGESANSSEVSATPLVPATSVQVTVDVLSDRHPISPYVYGVSYPQTANDIANSGATLVRWGGNATSRYNWQKQVYNSAADYYFEDYPLSEIGDSDSTQFLRDVIAAGSSPLMTMVMLDWVAKDALTTSHSFSVAKYGPQCKVDP